MTAQDGADAHPEHNTEPDVGAEQPTVSPYAAAAQGAASDTAGPSPHGRVYVRPAPHASPQTPQAAHRVGRPAVSAPAGHPTPVGVKLPFIAVTCGVVGLACVLIPWLRILASMVLFTGFILGTVTISQQSGRNKAWGWLAVMISVLAFVGGIIVSMIPSSVHAHVS